MHRQMYRVQVNGRYRYFDTLGAARAFCNEVHRQTKIVLGIELCLRKVS